MTNKSAEQHISHIRKCVWSIFLLFLLSGCGEGPIWTRDDPDEVLNGFLVASEAMDTATMWEYLSRSTQDILKSESDKFNQTAPENGKREPHEMMRTFHVISSTREFKKLETVSSDKKTAIVQIVMHEGDAISVRLIREDKRWAIELPFQTGKP